MTTYMTTVKGTNRYGGPFSHIWEVQRWLNERDYRPDEWDFTDVVRERLSGRRYGSGPAELKNRLDNDEFDVPCGERAFDGDHVDVFAHYSEKQGAFEVILDAECVECGFKHSTTEILTPTPK